MFFIDFERNQNDRKADCASYGNIAEIMGAHNEARKGNQRGVGKGKEKTKLLFALKAVCAEGQKHHQITHPGPCGVPAGEGFVSIDPVGMKPGGKGVVISYSEQITEAYAPPQIFDTLHAEKLGKHGDHADPSGCLQLYHELLRNHTADKERDDAEADSPQNAEEHPVFLQEEVLSEIIAQIGRPTERKEKTGGLLPPIGSGEEKDRARKRADQPGGDFSRIAQPESEEIFGIV